MVASTRAPAPADDDRIADHVERFVEAARQLGINDGAERLFQGDLVVVRLTIDEVTEQTPGEHAGRALTTES